MTYALGLILKLVSAKQLNMILNFAFLQHTKKRTTHRFDLPFKDRHVAAVVVVFVGTPDSRSVRVLDGSDQTFSEK